MDVHRPAGTASSHLAGVDGCILSPDAGTNSLPLPRRLGGQLAQPQRPNHLAATPARLLHTAGFHPDQAGATGLTLLVRGKPADEENPAGNGQHGGASSGYPYLYITTDFPLQCLSYTANTRLGVRYNYHGNGRNNTECVLYSKHTAGTP
jgi:hypothetical protein